MKAREQRLQTIAKGLLSITGKNSSKYSRAKYDAIWELCYKWNSANPENEIFMAEELDEEGNYRIYLEDDYFIYYEQEVR